MSVFLHRRASFSAGITGRSGAPTGGHNYDCVLTVRGEIDPVTGMVVNIAVIETVLKRHVVLRFNGKLLDCDIPEFVTRPASPENIALSIWRSCLPDLPACVRLTRVRLHWSRSSWVTISASPTNDDSSEDDPMVSVTRMYDFSASHRLNATALSVEENADIFGKCNRENGHGHNYEIEVTFSGLPDPESGELIPPGIVDRIVNDEVLVPFDHRHLNLDVPEFATRNPTSENLTVVIWDRIAARLRREGGTARLSRVAVRETARNYFEYYGPDA